MTTLRRERRRDRLEIELDKLVNCGQTPQRIDGVALGEVVGLAPSGDALVRIPSVAGERVVAARLTAALPTDSVDAAVAVMFERGDPEKPIVIGLLHGKNPTLEADGERREIRAGRELVLRVGKASITLTAAGKVLIRGSYVLSRSSGANRIKGGSVQIN